MKISTNTLNILKNFSKINSSVIIPEGNTIRTISASKTIMAKATVDTNFEKRFAIYNLDEFLSVHSLFTNPELVFNDTYVELYEGNDKQKYLYAEESGVQKAPEKDINLPSVDASFVLTNEYLKKVEKAAAILSMPEIVIEGDGSTLSFKATDVKNPSSNEYSIEVGTTDKIFSAVFKLENLRMIPGDYQVSISSKGISKFEGEAATYWVAIEASSKF